MTDHRQTAAALVDLAEQPEALDHPPRVASGPRTRRRSTHTDAANGRRGDHVSPNAQQTAAALVDLARAIAATCKADTYQDGSPMPPAVSLHRPSAAVVALLADIGRSYPGIAWDTGHQQIVTLDFPSAWVTIFAPSSTVVDADAPDDYASRVTRDCDHRTRAAAAIVALASSPRVDERQAIPVVNEHEPTVYEPATIHYHQGWIDAEKAVTRGKGTVMHAGTSGGTAPEDREYNRGWDAYLDAIDTGGEG